MPPSIVVCAADETRKGNNKKGKWHIESNEPSYLRKLKKHYRKLKRR